MDCLSIGLPFWLWTWVVPRNLVLDGVQVLEGGWAILRRGTGRPSAKCADFAVSRAKIAEPIQMLFGMWIPVHPRKHVLNGCTLSHLANTIEPSICGSDEAFCHNTLTTCYHFNDSEATDISVMY